MPAREGKSSMGNSLFMHSQHTTLHKNACVHTTHIHAHQRTSRGRKKENHPKTYGCVHQLVVETIKTAHSGWLGAELSNKNIPHGGGGGGGASSHAKALRYYNVGHRSLYSSTPFYCVCVFVSTAEHQWRQ